MVYLQITIRVISILALLMLLILKTSRRKIGELPVFDFLAIIILGSVVGADIADPKVAHLPTAYAVVLLIAIQFIVSHFIMKNRVFGGKVTFGPTVVIQNGQFVKSNMKRLRYTLDDILMHLRQKDVFDVSEVEFAIVEDSGKVSVLKKSQYQPVTAAEMSLPTQYKGMSMPLIIDGKGQNENLQKMNLSRQWLLNQLQEHGIHSIEDVFYAEINTQGKLYISRVVDAGNITDDFTLV
ncbi:MAG: DUF421 domain-containing protein [Firmicutes bacterium]|nr:DUF421 domain-containing protein [Bacillota bacterium]